MAAPCSGGWWWLASAIQAARTLSGWSTRWSRARASTSSRSPRRCAVAIATIWRSRVDAASSTARARATARRRASNEARPRRGSTGRRCRARPRRSSRPPPPSPTTSWWRRGVWVIAATITPAADSALTPRWRAHRLARCWSTPCSDRSRCTRDGQPVTVPGGKTAELLVRLALDAGTPVSADRLLDELWGGAATRRNTLQSKVTRLRRALADPARDRRCVQARRRPGARSMRCACCATPPAAARRLQAGDDHGARELSSAALAASAVTCCPPPATGRRRTAPQLEEARAKLLETQLAARLRLGEAGDRRARGRRGREPYREPLWELLITALYRAGRQADALAAYQRVRAALADELGLEPGPRLKELELRVLQQDPALARGAGRATSRRCGPSSSAATRSRAAARAARRPSPRRGRRPGRHRQDGAGDRDRAAADRGRLARRGSRRRRPPATSLTR